MSAAGTPALFRGLCDDAALFPPGNLPLAAVVGAHLDHRRAPYGGLVGPLVVSAAHLPGLAEHVAHLAAASLDVAVVVPAPAAAAGALRAAGRLPALRLVALEIAVPDDLPAEAVLPVLDAGLGDAPDLRRYVELPRDRRRADLIAELAGLAGHCGSPYLAKLRTGGGTADLPPGVDELAGAVVALARAGVGFKATAGLHHAVRGTDSRTGFEQHGFLNLLAAAAAARSGAEEPEVAAVLAGRDGPALAERVRGLDPDVRSAFVSFGTCSIDRPVADLVGLGLLPARHLSGAGVAR